MMINDDRSPMDQGGMVQGLLNLPAAEPGVRGGLLGQAALSGLDAMGAMQYSDMPQHVGNVLAHTNAADRQRFAQRQAEQEQLLKMAQLAQKGQGEGTWVPYTGPLARDPKRAYQQNTVTGQVKPVGGGPLVDFGERVGKKEVMKLVGGLSERGQAIQNTLGIVNELENLYAEDRTGRRGKAITGAFADDREGVERFFRTFAKDSTVADAVSKVMGTKGANMSRTARIKALGTQLALVNAESFKGNLNMEEIKMIQDAGIRLSQTPEQAEMIISDLKRRLSGNLEYLQGAVRVGKENQDNPFALHEYMLARPGVFNRGGGGTPAPAATPGAPAPAPGGGSAARKVIRR
jgi:hypothetical protein